MGLRDLAVKRPLLVRTMTAAAVLLVVAAAGTTQLQPQSNAQTLEWRPGISANELRTARILRVPHGLRLNDLSALRDDQVLEAPSGRQIQVGRFRQILQAFQTARVQIAQHRPQEFRILAPTPNIAPVALRPHESAAEILARPPDDVVRLKDGHTATVAQLRALAPYVEKRYHVDLSDLRAPPTGPAIRITSVAQLTSLAPNLPDNTVLETPSGKRVTVGQIRKVIRSRPWPSARVTPIQARPR